MGPDPWRASLADAAPPAAAAPTPPPVAHVTEMASSLDGSSDYGNGSSSGGAITGGASLGATALTTQRRSLGATPLKKVASRVPVRDVIDQPLLSQARQLLDDQRTK